jgi:hypothetical protein
VGAAIAITMVFGTTVAGAATTSDSSNIFPGLRLAGDPANPLLPYTSAYASTATSGSVLRAQTIGSASTTNHYVVNVPDPNDASRQVINLGTNEALNANGSVVRNVIHAPNHTFEAGDTGWIVREVYFPSDFPNMPVKSGSDQTQGHPGAGWFSWAGDNPRGLTSTGQTTIQLDWSESLSTNRFSWSAQDLSGHPHLWLSVAATRGVWHIVAKHIYFARDKTGWMEIYYGTRATASSAATPLTLQTLKPATGVTLTNNNTRRVGFQTANDSTITPYPGIAPSVADYHMAGMDNFSGYNGSILTGIDGIYRDNAGTLTARDVDPYYTGVK